MSGLTARQALDSYVILETEFKEENYARLPIEVKQEFDAAWKRLELAAGSGVAALRMLEAEHWLMEIFPIK